MCIFVTGGAGYIGTHTCVELLNAGFEVTVFDNFCHSHPEALARLQAHAECLTVNLGTGTGYSVLEMVRAFEHASGRPVPYRIAARRPGDIAAFYADPKLALDLLGWKAERGLEAMCADAWRWQSGNPNGYGA